MERMGVKGRISSHFPTDVMWVQITLRNISCCNCTANANILMSSQKLLWDIQTVYLNQYTITAHYFIISYFTSYYTYI